MANTFGFPPTIQLTWPMAPTFPPPSATSPLRPPMEIVKI